MLTSWRKTSVYTVSLTKQYLRCISLRLNSSNKHSNIMSAGGAQMDTMLLQEAIKVVPKMSKNRHKGAAGRIGVIGGSIEYTGAPYFSAIAAMKVGCDLAHVFCQKSAAPVIKSYSPELIVHPFLDEENAVKLITPWLSRLHVLVIGPGLGREPKILQAVTSIIQFSREQSSPLPLVIDADGLFMVTLHPEVIQDYPSGIIVTPNAMEFSRLAKAVLNENWEATPNPEPSNVSKLAGALGPDVVVVHKGASDVIATGEESFMCTAAGSGRRCGGQGDLLSGSLGTFYGWAIAAQIRHKWERGDIPAGVVASYAACRLTRECNMRAFHKLGRSTLTSDMIREIHEVFSTLFEME